MITDVVRCVLGEANSDFRMDKYNCSLIAMIDDWREKFHAGSALQTSNMFPFGIVQVRNIFVFTQVFFFSSKLKVMDVKSKCSKISFFLLLLIVGLL